MRNLGLGEERRAGTGREENVSNGQVHEERWSGALRTSSEATARKGGYRESNSSVARFMHKSKGTCRKDHLIFLDSAYNSRDLRF